MKRHYKRPATRVVALHGRLQLLSGSNRGISGEISGYQKSSGGFTQDEGGSGVKGQGNYNVWDED